MSNNTKKNPEKSEKKKIIEIKPDPALESTRELGASLKVNKTTKNHAP